MDPGRWTGHEICTSAWRMRRALALLALLLLSTGALAARPAQRAAAHHQVDKGLVSHGEHLADFVLTGNVKPYARFVRRLTTQIGEGRLRDVNEKFDGSPSIVLGFSTKGPFVAYKRELERKKGPQRLVHTPAEAQALFRRSPALAKAYASLIEHTREAMAGLQGTDLEGLVFQGDLLFSEGSDRKTVSDDRIIVRPNQVSYEVGRDDPDFGRLSEAKVGFVIHTIGKRMIGTDGRIGIRPASRAGQRDQLERFVERLGSKQVFALHPLRPEIALERPSGTPPLDDARAGALLRRIQAIDRLSPAFFEEWHGK